MSEVELQTLHIHIEIHWPFLKMSFQYLSNVIYL